MDSVIVRAEADASEVGRGCRAEFIRLGDAGMTSWRESVGQAVNSSG